MTEANQERKLETPHVNLTEHACFWLPDAFRARQWEDPVRHGVVTVQIR